MGHTIDGPSGLILQRDEVVGYRGETGEVRLYTAEQTRKILRYGHLRHIYWLVQHRHLPYRKFGRELVFTEMDIEQFRLRRGY